MAKRKRTLTEADRRAAARARELWAEYQRKNPGISQEVAASRAGMGQSAFSQFLRGVVPMRVSPVIAFAKLFGVDPKEIRPDIAELMGAAGNEPGAEYLPADALEIARAFARLQPQTKEIVRWLVFVHSVVDRDHPWLRIGRPISPNYEKFEKNHRQNMHTQLTLEAARIVEAGKKK